MLGHRVLIVTILCVVVGIKENFDLESCIVFARIIAVAVVIRIIIIFLLCLQLNRELHERPLLRSLSCLYLSRCRSRCLILGSCLRCWCVSGAASEP